MIATHVASARNLLGIVRQESDAIGVAVSFGKDSLATLDLCCAMFPRVEAYYLYRVREMDIVTQWCNQAEQRYGVRVRQYPHFDLVRCYRQAVLQPHWSGMENTSAIKLIDIEGHFRRAARVDWIAYGWRRNDSFSRALIMRRCRGLDFGARRVFPLRSFRRQQVYSYLAEQDIPRPETFGRKEQGGLDFAPGSLRVLRDQYPADWQRWLTDFPFSEVQILAARGAHDRAAGG